MVHAGSWLGLPDFGITEAIQRRIAPSANLTAQGGSNLGNLQQAYSPAPTQNYSAMNYSVMPTSSGSVLGTTTSQPTGTSAPSTGGTTNTEGSGPSVPSLLDQNYAGMFANLDQQMADLNSQRAGQEQIANNTYQQGLNTLTNQYTQNENTIKDSQTKTLNDLENNLRMAFQQGNIALGQRGASDSSAANAYSFALAKEATKNRAGVMSEVATRLSNLKSTYDTNIQNLELQKNSQLQQIAGWFSEAQNQIRTMEAGLQKEKSEQALNIALQMYSQVQQQAAQQKSVLDQWAANHATSLQQLQQQMQSTTANLPTFQGLNSTITGGGAEGTNLFGYGTSSEEKKRLF